MKTLPPLHRLIVRGFAHYFTHKTDLSMNISCSVFTRFNDDEIGTFADVVFTKMDGVVIYTPFQTTVTALKPVMEAFSTAYINAKDGGSKLIRAKREARLALNAKLTSIAKLMDAEWTDNSHDAEKKDAGFTLNKVPNRQTLAFIGMPTNFKAVNDERHGVVNLFWTPVFKARTYAIEVLQADGTWKNGLYTDRNRYQFTDLQRGTELTVRIKTIGPDTLTSEWTEPVTVFVD
jgi:hypothetical protein